jgi:O-antigen/teichoic acid export membrane protein
MKRSFLHNISANILQIATNQLLGLVIFYLVSRYLTKEAFGEINWTLSVLLMAFNILCFGLDQMVVRKIAADEDPSGTLSLFIFHVAFTGFLFYGALLIFYQVFPGFFHDHSLLLLLGIGKLMLFFSVPFKQLASGLQKFHLVLYMSVPSNLVKGAALTWMAVSNRLDLTNTILIFMAADLFEFAFCLVLSSYVLKVRLRFKHIRPAYVKLFRESLPQFGTVLFSSAMARFDWIFIGVFLSAAKLAEYSFAYKVFEMATFPLLVVAPLLIPLFTRLVKQGSDINNNKNLLFLLKLELIAASFIALLINCVWVPVIDPLTSGKYGSVNRSTIFILTLVMPALYLNNFFWTLLFARGDLKRIFRIFGFTFLINVIANILLIPVLKNEGAALAFLLSSFFQTILYVHAIRQPISVSWQPMVITALCALGSGLIAREIFSSHWQVLAFAAVLYVFLLLLTLQLKKADWSRLKGGLNL